MIAKSLDVLVFLKLLLDREKKPYAILSRELGISASEIHAAVQRGIASGLISEHSRKPIRKALEEYLVHGVRYAFPAKLGHLARGMPTAYGAPPLVQEIRSDEPFPVWSDPQGTVRGFAVEPLYNSVAFAAKADPRLYELIALIDAIRLGRVRERKLAEAEIKKRLSHADSN